MPSQLLEAEGYIQTDEGMFIIKEINKDEDEINVFAVGDAEELKGNVVKSFSFTTVTVGAAINTLLAQIPNHSWTCQVMNNITRKRSTKTSYKTVWDNLLEIEKLFHVDLKFNIKEKKIYVYEYNQMGEDKGVYAIDKLNLDNLSIDENTEDFATRLYAYGKDGLSFSGEYIDNNEYSNKIISAYWTDERYSDAESLLEDAQYKLAELAKPAISYQAKVVDLASLNNAEYYTFTMQLGDMVRIKSTKNGIDVKQRVVKIERYPEAPEKNTITFSTKKKSLADAQALRQKFVENIEDSFDSDGAVTNVGEDAVDTDNIKDGAVTDSKIVDLSANKITAGTIDAANIEVINLKAENITVGTINGNQIAQGAIDMGNLSQTVINEINSGGSTGIKSFYQATAPTEAGEGDLWFNTAKDNSLSIYENGEWVAFPFGAEALSANSITSEKIATGAITAGKIAAGAIQTTNLASGAVTADKISANAITSEKIAAESITGDKIAANTLISNSLKIGKSDTDYAMAFDGTTGKITFGSGVSMSWNDITDTPTIPTSTSDLTNDSGFINSITATSITNNAISTATINANQITGSAFDLSSGTYSVTASSSGEAMISIQYYPYFCNLSADGLVFEEGSTVTSYSAQNCSVPKVYADYVYLGSESIRTIFATKSSVDNKYGYGDDINVGEIKSATTYSDTVSYQTNMYVGTSGILHRTTNTSSREIKHDIAPLADTLLDADKLYNAEVVQFKYNDDILPSTDMRYDMLLPGFIVEDLINVYPAAVDIDENGKPFQWNAQYLLPPMLKLIQNQKKEINELESRIAELEERLGM